MAVCVADRWRLPRPQATIGDLVNYCRDNRVAYSAVVLAVIQNTIYPLRSVRRINHIISACNFRSNSISGLRCVQDTFRELNSWAFGFSIGIKSGM